VDLLDREGSHPRGGELERERNAVQVGAEARHRARAGPRALPAKEAARGRAPGIAAPHPSPGSRPHPFRPAAGTRDRAGRPARPRRATLRDSWPGSKDAASRAAGSSRAARIHREGARSCPGRGARSGPASDCEARRRRAFPKQAVPAGLRPRRVHAVIRRKWVRGRRTTRHPGNVPPRLQHALRKARLADSAGAHEGEKAMVLQQGARRVEIAGPAHEAARRGWNVRMAGCGGWIVHFAHGAHEAIAAAGERFDPLPAAGRARERTPGWRKFVPRGCCPRPRVPARRCRESAAARCAPLDARVRFSGPRRRAAPTARVGRRARELRCRGRGETDRSHTSRTSFIDS
jgi:hypothetical protein